MEQTINAKTKVCGLIGYPVGHSVSPVIHNNLAQMYGQNLVYVPLQVEKGKLDKAIGGADAFDFLGMNVTVPYKSEVMPFLTDIDSLAEKIGAVNTLVRVEGGYKGYNTDMPGLYRAMVSDGVSIEKREVILLGAGGVARAVAIMLLEKGAARVFIMNRTVEKAQAVADEVNTFAGYPFAVAMDLEGYKELPEGKKYLVIQGTNVGMYPNVDQAVIEDQAFYEKVEIGYDIIFNPMETKFMSLTKQAGGSAYHGLKMLLYQGVIAFELWTGQKISEADSDCVYELMKQALQG